MQPKLNRIYGIIYRHVLMWPRNIESLAEVFWWPTFDLFLWGLASVYIQKYGTGVNNISGFFLGGILLWVLIYRSQQDIGILFLWEVWDHNLLNILSTPLTLGEYYTGILLLGLMKLTITIIWMSILAYILFTFSILQVGWYLVPFVINLILVGWTAGFFINGLIVLFGVRAQATAWIMICLIQPFSAVLFPLSILPHWVQAVSRFVPSSYIFEGMREVLGGNTLDLMKLVSASLLNLIYLTLAVIFFYTCYRKALKNGMIVKFS